MAAKQRLTKGRIKARQKKMQHIARLLDIPGQSGPPSPAYVSSGMYARGHNLHERRPMFHTTRVPGFAAPRRESLPGVIHKVDAERRKRDNESPNRAAMGKKEDRPNGPNIRSRESSGNRVRSREGSPRMPRPRSEEIPLEIIKKAPSSVIDMSPKVPNLPRPQTPKVEPEPSTSKESQVVVVGSSSLVSEETSFIAQEKNSASKKKGVVETV